MLKEAVLHKRSKANDIIKATLRGHLETVKELLEESEEGLSSHIEGYSLLHLAAALNHGDIVDELLQRKIEVNKSSEGGFTALHGASITGSSSVVESLIKREADVDRLANGFGPLHFASMYGNTNTARILIQHQANIHLKGYHQWSPLHVASIHNQPDLVRLLLENNADVEALSEDLSTPLVFASYLNNMDIADRGAKVNHVSAVGVSALHGAAYMGAMDVLECLLENEADPNLKLFEGISPEEKSKIASHVEQWCKNTPGKDINLRRYDGGSALHVAVDMGYTDMVRLLLKSGADPNLRNMDNEIAIDIAREKKHSGILRLLESS
ncbi:ankyrin-1-like [Haliotis rubra]|uniref:ankyrin-1-like n=1 Tax=Haliotis rubra TaxID=36100 RepID=UPI001EE568FB|nr:ankyrin-1-like [Haliotis rubra]